jgi:uncharacterized protein
MRTKKVRKPAPPPASVVSGKISALRQDSWQNAATGFGVFGRDKRMTAEFALDLLDPSTCEAIWRGNGLGARAIELVADEMLRPGWEVTIDDDKALSDALEAEDTRLDLKSNLTVALHTARALGGAGIVLNVDDGRPIDQPVKEDRIRSIKALNTFSCQELIADRWYNDPLEPKYGEVAVWRITPHDLVPGAEVKNFPRVHESRVLRFNGVRTTRKNRFLGMTPGWDDSILCRAYETLRDFCAAFQGVGILVADFSVAVLKLKNLAQILSTEAGQALQERAAGIEAARSIARVLLIDTEEEYARQTTPVAGLPDLLEKLMLRLAADFKMPVGLLFGQGPTGLNATGDADMNWFDNQVVGERERDLTPQLMRYYRLLMLAKEGPAKGQLPDGWSIKYNPQRQLTELEQTTMRKTVADTDAVYIANEVVTPEEVGLSRFGGAGYSTEMNAFNRELREKLMEDEALQAEQLGAQATATAQENEQKALDQPVVLAEKKAGETKLSPKAKDK